LGGGFPLDLIEPPSGNLIVDEVLYLVHRKVETSCDLPRSVETIQDVDRRPKLLQQFAV
jgi:hypothetical protein